MERMAQNAVHVGPHPQCIQALSIVATSDLAKKMALTNLIWQKMDMNNLIWPWKLFIE